MENKKVPFEVSDYVLKKYFLETGTRQGWLNDEKIAAATSGGGDSIALLWMCKKFFAGEVVALHINHGIRGQESDGDENFTREFAKNIGANFESEKISVPTSREKGESLEAAARRLRLQKLCEIAHTLNIKNILLGHNRDDLAETVLFNIIRGTGIRGSVGMTEHSTRDNVNFFRPLLGMRREFLREILRSRNISWREDSTNNQENYTRNFIRLKLLPFISENINASVIEHLASFGEDMRKIRTREDNDSRELLSACQVPPFRGGFRGGEPLSSLTLGEGMKKFQERENFSGCLVLDRKKLRQLDDDARALIIREAGRKLQLKTLSRTRCNELAKLFAKDGNFIFQWCDGVNVTGKSGKIFFEVKNS